MMELYTAVYSPYSFAQLLVARFGNRRSTFELYALISAAYPSPYFCYANF